ncbi:Nodulin MtN21 family protein [Musa troglodytarum]|uniref:Nodulin MtN21 family protein n=1 Tax=Musa troglodytarum TaxID=320322 RepID=A0A9E7GNK4_9LILI|nr:Nodulin MtN21 family protein [Musa troglodytarum]
MAFMGKLGPLLSMIYVQVAYAAMFLITRLAFTRGMSHYSFVLYRQIIAAMAICPLACFLDKYVHSDEVHYCMHSSVASSFFLSFSGFHHFLLHALVDSREIGRLAVGWKNAGQIFLLALMGICISQNFYYAGLAYTSSTFVGTMNNLQPVVTFLLAYLLRLEEVSIKNRTGQAKILGTFLCVGGAMVMTLFKDHNGGQGLRAQMDPIFSPQDLGGGTSFVLGALFTIVGTTAWSAFLLYQACVVAQYPSQLTLSGLVNLIGGLQCAVISLSFEKPAALKLRWDLPLLAIAYSVSFSLSPSFFLLFFFLLHAMVAFGGRDSDTENAMFLITLQGIFCAGFGMFAVMWCVKETGPVYVTAFGPMSAVMVAILEPLLLHVQLTWSSLIGLVMVIGGLFLFLWGKAQDSSGAGEAFAATHGVGEWDRNEASVYEEEPSNQEPLLA